MEALRSTNCPPVDPDPLAEPVDPEAVLPAALPVDPLPVEPVLPDAVLPLPVDPDAVPDPIEPMLPLPRCRQPVTVTSPPCIRLELASGCELPLCVVGGCEDEPACPADCACATPKVAAAAMLPATSVRCQWNVFFMILSLLLRWLPVARGHAPC
jgi:hypothetical protein